MQQPSFDVQRMIALRLAGWNFSALGREFGKDHTTMMYHCRRHNVPHPIQHLRAYPRPPERKEEIARQTPARPKPHPYAHILEEPRNEGKSYSEYLKESLTRPIERRYHAIYYETTITAEDAYKTRSTDDADSFGMVPEDFS